MSKSKVIDRRTWLYFRVSVLFFPLFPALGALGFVVVMFVVWRHNYRQMIQSPLNRAWVILACLLILTCIFAEDSVEAWLGLANFLPFFALFAALENLIIKPIQLRQLSWLLILPSLPIMLLGFGQMYGAWDTPVLIESVLGWQLVPQGLPPGRMSAVFINSNFLAIYLILAFSLTFGLWLETWQGWRQEFTTKQAQVVLLTLILLFDLGGLVLSSSRSAWGLAVIIFIAYAVYLNWRWLLWAVGSAVTAILWAFLSPNLDSVKLRQIVPTFIWIRLSSQTYSDRAIEKLRITQWQFCWDLIKERPLFGWGLRNFSPLYEAKTNFWLGHPHNLFLMLGMEVGVVALLLLMGIIAAIAVRACQLLRNWSSKESPLIFFSYLVAWAGCIIFNLADVSIFDLRINTISWIALAAINGVTNSRLTENKVN